MSRSRRFFIRTLPAVFLAGTLFGSGITSITAAFRASAIFRDVPSTHYADEAIGEMYQLGIIKGLDSSHFGPDEPLTRGQAALLFQRLRNELKGITSSVSSSRTSTSSSSSSPVSSSESSSSSSSSYSSSYNPGGHIRFNANEFNVDKNVATGEVVITIVRIGGNAGAGTIDYSFSGGTAIAGKNYTPLSGTLSFATKETSKQVKMKIFNDTTTSGTKTVMLTLKKPTGALALGEPSTVTLDINDPNVPTSSSGISSSVSAATTISLSASGYGVSENGGSLTITVNRTGITTSVVGVNYATVDGTAKSGIDFSSAAGTFTFAAGETVKTFAVPISDNTSIEGSRVFSVVLTNPTGGAALLTQSASVTINDNEAVPIIGSGSMKFSTTSYTATEAAGQAIITVQHIGGFGAATVNYATNGGSALAGSDYASTSGTLNFAAGETSKVFIIPIYGDSVVDPGETVYMSLSNPTGGTTLSDPSSATLTIGEN